MECLVTKLKGSVSDTSIYKIGEIRLKKVKRDSWIQKEQSFVINSTADVNLSVSGGGYFTNEDGTENKGTVMKYSPSQTNMEIYVSNTEGAIISIVSKYVLTRIIIRNAYTIEDLSQLNYANSLTHIEVGTEFVGNIDDLTKLDALTSLLLSVNGVSGSLESVTKFPTLKSINVSNSRITGDISSIANLTALSSLMVQSTSITGNINTLRCPLTTLIVDNSPIVGSLEEFVQVQRAAGRTSGQCTISNTLGCNLTFKGSTIAIGDKQLSWTNSNITYDGDSISA